MHLEWNGIARLLFEMEWNISLIYRVADRILQVGQRTARAAPVS
jgi:hypothetical protein